METIASDSIKWESKVEKYKDMVGGRLYTAHSVITSEAIGHLVKEVEKKFMLSWEAPPITTAEATIKITTTPKAEPKKSVKVRKEANDRVYSLCKRETREAKAELARLDELADLYLAEMGPKTEEPAEQEEDSYAASWETSAPAKPQPQKADLAGRNVKKVTFGGVSFFVYEEDDKPKPESPAIKDDGFPTNAARKAWMAAHKKFHK